LVTPGITDGGRDRRGGWVQELELDLDVYQGPFDLLFTLILKEEVDIFEVPLFDIILSFVGRAPKEGEAGDAGAQTPGVDWDGLSEFLVLMSWLMELKSRFLLPGEEPESEEIDPDQAREQLLERLLQYQTFKTAAVALRERGRAQRGRLLRDASRRRLRVLAPLEEVEAVRDVSELARSMQRLLEARNAPDTSHMPVIRVELARQLSMVRRLLEAGGRFSFEKLFGREPAAVQAVTLFALLELLSRGEIVVSQAKMFGDISVRAGKARQIA
jgi:segregation and condensation protein A